MSKLKTNIEARKLAQEAYDFAIEYIDTVTVPDEVKEAAKIKLKNLTGGVGPKDPIKTETKLEPMDHVQSIAFQLQRISFGKHMGEEIKNIPVDYLVWLDSRDPTPKSRFKEQLRRYLKSEIGQRIQEKV